ncbi:MAG: FmdB family zinc ribbon protein [Pseudonocardiaceae bacterium]
MAIYSYRCPVCGPFELQLPMGDGVGQRPCPGCSRTSRRLFTAPFLVRTPPSLAAQLHRAQASREVPEVVTAVPPAARRRSATAANPAWATLPRP